MAKTPDLELMKQLAVLGAAGSKVHCTTLQLASALCTSQQSASRRVRALADCGFIDSIPGTRGIEIALTRKGVSFLEGCLAELSTAILPAGPRVLRGIVSAGLGEGRYYISQPHYNKPLAEALGGRVYPGTLNLRVAEAELREFVSGKKPSVISGFSNNEREFGALSCFPVSINSIQCGALVLPERTTHPPETAELVAPIFLRKKFSLKDGDSVSIQMNREA